MLLGNLVLQILQNNKYTKQVIKNIPAFLFAKAIFKLINKKNNIITIILCKLS